MTALSKHGLHLGTLLGPALLLAFWAGWADLRAWMHRQGALTPSTVLLAALLSAGAGAAHLLVCPAHFSEDPLYGVFFAAAAAGQFLWAAVVVNRPGTAVLVAGIGANTAVVALWALTRTAGIPLGASAGRREPVGTLDVTTALLELAVIACCARALRRRTAPFPHPARVAPA